MEPKLSTNSTGVKFPYEPGFSGPFEEKKAQIPKIVPAELQSAPVHIPKKNEVASEEARDATVSDATTSTSVSVSQSSSGNSKVSHTSEPSPDRKEHDTTITVKKDPKALMASLSKDLDELSTPLDKSNPEFKDFPVENGITYPPENDLGDPEEPPSPSGILRSVMLFICFVVVCLCTWQVTLFLQPSFMQKEPFSTVSEQSCKFFYCPPVRPLRILSSEMEAMGNDQWMITLQIQNQDMRSQQLPQIQISLINNNNTFFQKIFSPSGYTAIPSMKKIKGGLSVKVQIPFTYSEGRPTNFTVKVLDN